MVTTLMRVIVVISETFYLEEGGQPYEYDKGSDEGLRCGLG